MPATITKVNGGYQVRTPNAVHATHATKANAIKQAKILNGIEHGWRPTGKK